MPHRSSTSKSSRKPSNQLRVRPLTLAEHHEPTVMEEAGGDSKFAFNSPLVPRGQKQKTHKRDLAEDEEEVLVEHLLRFQNMFYDIQEFELRRRAFDFATELGIPHKFDKNTKLADRKWMKDFLQRHPEIRVSIPEPGQQRRVYTLDIQTGRRLSKRR